MLRPETAPRRWRWFDVLRLALPGQDAARRAGLFLPDALDVLREASELAPLHYALLAVPSFLVDRLEG